MGFCSCTVKFFLFAFNFIISICSIALMVIGGVSLGKGQWITADKTFTNDIGYLFRPAAITIIVVGVIIFLISFMGCCGAIQESPCMITTYAIFLLIILVVELIIGIVALVYRNQVADVIGKTLHEQPDQTLIIELQKSLECCGWKGPNELNAILPSCCKSANKNCTIDSKDLFRTGCQTAIEDYIKHHLAMIGGVAIGFAVLEVLAVICGCFLANTFRKAERGF